MVQRLRCDQGLLELEYCSDFSGMTEGNGNQVFTDAAWAIWEPLIEAVRPRGKTPPKEVRRIISAILWRHQNGAKWRSIPAELGPWWLAAQLFTRWVKQGSRSACSTSSSSTISRSA